MTVVSLYENHVKEFFVMIFLVIYLDTLGILDRVIPYGDLCNCTNV